MIRCNKIPNQQYSGYYRFKITAAHLHSVFIMRIVTSKYAKTIFALFHNSNFLSEQELKSYCLIELSVIC